jgi:hypothetical protein
LREGSTSFCEQKEAKKLFESGPGARSWAAKEANVYLWPPKKPVMPAKAELRLFGISIVCGFSYGFSFALF